MFHILVVDVYVKIREECEEKLTELIKIMKVEIAEMKKQAKNASRTEGRPQRLPLKICGAESKENPKWLKNS